MHDDDKGKHTCLYETKHLDPHYLPMESIFHEKHLTKSTSRNPKSMEPDIKLDPEVKYRKKIHNHKDKYRAI